MLTGRGVGGVERVSIFLPGTDWLVSLGTHQYRAIYGVLPVMMLLMRILMMMQWVVSGRPCGSWRGGMCGYMVMIVLVVSRVRWVSPRVFKHTTVCSYTLLTAQCCRGRDLSTSVTRCRWGYSQSSGSSSSTLGFQLSYRRYVHICVVIHILYNWQKKREIKARLRRVNMDMMRTAKLSELNIIFRDVRWLKSYYP